MSPDRIAPADDPRNGADGVNLDPLTQFFDFTPSFDDAVAWVRSPDSMTRVSLHQLVSAVSIRLHVERMLLLPLLEELQFTLGEGPCLDAHHQGIPVLEPDLAHPHHIRWPAMA